MPVIWQDAMSVGNMIIDDEHKYLFCLINSVEIALKLDDNERVMKMLIDQLEKYTTDHFRREERVQIKIKYPGYLEHKLEHQKILDNIAELKLKLFPVEKDSPPAVAQPATSSPEPVQEASPSAETDVEVEVVDYDASAAEDESVDEAKDKTVTEQVVSAVHVPDDDVVALLRDWVLGHVLKTDMKMKRHLGQYPSNFA